MDKLEGIVKAYEGGLLANKTSFLIEGVGSRITNWGRSINVIIKDANPTKAKEAVETFGMFINNDRRNRRSSNTGTTTYLTTFDEGLSIANSLGVQTVVEQAVDQIGPGESTTINLRNHTSDILVTVCEAIMRETTLNEAEKTDFESLLINAFEQGMRGLAVGGTDLSFLQRGEDMLSRYDSFRNRKVA